MPALRKLAHRNHARKLSIGRNIDKIHDRLTARRRRRIRHFVNFDLVDHAVVREDHQVRMRRRDEEMLDEVAVLRGRAEATFATTSLTCISRDRRALDVTAVRDSNRHVFISDEIFNRKLDTFVDDLRAAPVTKVFLNFLELFGDNATQRAFITENLFELGDDFDYLLVLVDDLLSLECGYPSQLQIENRLRLDLREGETLHRLLDAAQVRLELNVRRNALPCFDLARSLQLAHQPLSRFVNRARITNEHDDGVERIDRFRKPFENVRASTCLAQLVLGSLPHDLATKLDERLEHLFEIQDARLTIHDREIDHTKRRLHRRQLVKLIEHDLRHRISFQLDHDAHAGAVRLVTQIGNTLDLLLVD